jgi:anti-sigma factor ChrR (cupin superfamily)
MTDEDFLEFEIRRKLRWQRDGADWILLYGPSRRRLGRVVADRKHIGMYRIALSRGRFSDMAGRSWTKNGVMAAAIRELLWEVRHRPANDPSKCPVNRGSLAA